MKKLLILLTFFALMSCGGEVKQSDPHNNDLNSEEHMLCGGYTQFRVLETEDLELFNSLAAEVEGVKYEPSEVATQVVNGINYKFKAKEVETGKAVIVKIYKPLPNNGDPQLVGIEMLQ